MTTIKRRIRRETDVLVQGRPLVVELAREGVYIRRKRQRTRYLAPWAAIFAVAARLAARDALREKLAARAARKAGRR